MEPNSPPKQERAKQGDDLVLEVFPHFVDSVCSKAAITQGDSAL
jgi:hypothetical protein